MGARFLDTCMGEVFCFCNKSRDWFVNHSINRNNSPYEKNNPHTDCHTHLFWCRLYCFLFSVGGHTQLVSYIGQTFSYTTWYGFSHCLEPYLSVHGNFYRVDLAYVDNKTTNDYQIIGFQLLFNFTWSIFFFYLRSPLLGFANILVLDVLVVYYMIESYPVKKSSAYLFVPYLLWLILATYLNGYILMYN